MIGVTLGEYFGIGPEILLKTFADLQEKFPSVRIYGSKELLEKKASELGVEKFWETGDFELVDTYPHPDRISEIKDRQVSFYRAEYVLSTLDQSIKDAMSGSISSLVTCPIDKSIIQNVLPNFTGHTEYLAEKTGVDKTIMMLNNKEFSIALLTNHIPIRDISKKLKHMNIEETILTATRSLSRHFLIRDPKIALLAANPHAGELVLQSEESEIFIPAILNLRSQGIDIEGPFPADSFFPKARKENWDLVFSPFHDQGLVAAKYNGLENVVNITLGMPFLRVSPGHGVGYDIVYDNIADHRSFQRALLIAQKHSLKI